MDEATLNAVSVDNLNNLMNIGIGYATTFGVNILAAIAFWVVGRWLIGAVVGMVQRCAR